MRHRGDLIAVIIIAMLIWFGFTELWTDHGDFEDVVCDQPRVVCRTPTQEAP